MENFKFRFGVLFILVSLCCITNAVVDPTLSPIPNLRACTLPSVTGPCVAVFQRYYFDILTGQCRIFSYGGCQGNANNFETLGQCQAFGHGCLQRSEAPLPTRKPMSSHPPLDLQWVGRYPVTP